MSIERGGGVKERPILFSAPMVRAILSGAKTQTRRVIRASHATQTFHDEALRIGVDQVLATMPSEIACPYGVPGDRLWVRETWGLCRYGDITDWHRGPVDDDTREWFDVEYRASWIAGDIGHWRPSIHMPRWASRLTLAVVSVRVERLQDISEADAKAEGVVPLQMDHGSYKPAFEGLWDAINAKRAPWSSNPWVFVVEFRRVES